MRFVFDQLGFVEQCVHRFGDAFTLRLVDRREQVIFVHPDAVRDIYTAEQDVLTFGDVTADLLGPILGPNSLLLLDGPRHRRERRLMLPPFHGERMQGYGRLMQQVAREAIARWPVERPFPIQQKMQEITLEVIMRIVFGVDDGASLGRLRECLHRLVELPNSRAAALLFVPALRFDLGRWNAWGRFLRAREELREIVRAEVAARRAGGGDRIDVLSMLLEARDEHGTGMSEDEVFDELFTLLMAGHETTASQLSWALYRLLRHPDVLGRLRDELDGLARDDAVAPEAAAKLEYLDAVVKESQRLDPVATLSARYVRSEARIGGWTLPAGTRMAIAVHAAHRRPEAWPEAERFDPGRFLGARPAPYTYLPFGGGDRRCLGAAFATYEMKLVLAEVVRRAALRLRPRYRARPVLRAVAMGPSRGVPVLMVARRPGR
jgi:cytochrome P450